MSRFLPDSDPLFVERVMNAIDPIALPVRSHGPSFLAARIPLVQFLAAAAMAVVAFMVIVPAVLQSREATRRTLLCQENLRRIGQALNVYAEDHDERLPPQSGWGAALASFGPVGALRCPDARAGSPGYSFVQNLAGHPRWLFPEHRTPLAFESWAGQFRRRHSERGNVFFLDGSVRLVPSLGF